LCCASSFLAISKYTSLSSFCIDFHIPPSLQMIKSKSRKTEHVVGDVENGQYSWVMYRSV
jgi:hypothetical protein